MLLYGAIFFARTFFFSSLSFSYSSYSDVIEEQAIRVEIGVEINWN